MPNNGYFRGFFTALLIVNAISLAVATFTGIGGHHPAYIWGWQDAIQGAVLLAGSMFIAFVAGLFWGKVGNR